MSELFLIIMHLFTLPVHGLRMMSGSVLYIFKILVRRLEIHSYKYTSKYYSVHWFTCECNDVLSLKDFFLVTV